jgi:hypothetical protein
MILLDMDMYLGGDDQNEKQTIDFDICSMYK